MPGYVPGSERGKHGGCLMMLTVGQVERWEVETGINQVPRKMKVGWLETLFLGHRGELRGL